MWGWEACTFLQTMSYPMLISMASMLRSDIRNDIFHRVQQHINYIIILYRHLRHARIHTLYSTSQGCMHSFTLCRGSTFLLMRRRVRRQAFNHLHMHIIPPGLDVCLPMLSTDVRIYEDVCEGLAAEGLAAYLLFRSRQYPGRRRQHASCCTMWSLSGLDDVLPVFHV